MTLPTVTPELAATVLGRLAGRIRSRSEAMLADRASWTVTESAVTIGAATVTLRPTGGVLTGDDAVGCDCLLAPNCAHLAAVVAACPVADQGAGPQPDSQEPAEPPAVPAGRKPDPTAPRLTDRQVEALTDTWLVGANLLSSGAARRDTRTYTAALSALHKLRAAGLIRAERAFTGVVTALNRAVSDPQNLQPDTVVASLSDVLLTAHVLLQADRAGRPADPEYIGSARRKYAPIGAITATPFALEPVLTESGYAGSVLTLRDGQGRFWTIQDVRPGDVSQVRRSHGVGIEIGELVVSLECLSNFKLLIGQGTASADGRLGRGRSVRAALGDSIEYPAPWADIPRWPADASGWAIVAGVVTGGDEAGLVIRTATGEVPVTVPRAARLLGWGESALWLAAGRDIEVQCLVRRRGADADLVGVHRMGLDPDFGEDVHNVTWCGLDRLDVRDIGATREQLTPRAPTPTEIETFTVAAPGVALLVTRWLQRTVTGGLGAIRAATRELPADRQTLINLGAPFAAELLGDLDAATRAGTRAFDGTWQPDPEPLVRAWLALARYLA